MSVTFTNKEVLFFAVIDASIKGLNTWLNYLVIFIYVCYGREGKAVLMVGGSGKDGLESPAQKEKDKLFSLVYTERSGTVIWEF